ncbi:MAG: molybdate ABC transporter permease subunit [Flavobacteriales bacterium]|nr:molybdate ABC transporter permease subunit [Flavobacteriales bacterium]
MVDWSPIFLSLNLAFISTLVLFVIGIPIAYWLATSKSRFKPIIEALVGLPLVLPPTVLGFYLLLMMSPNSELGQFINRSIGMDLAFSFSGIVIGSIIYSLPFMVQPIQSGLSSVPVSLLESSYVLGKSRVQTLLSIMMPYAKNSIITGIVLSFAHTIGEFGVVLMIGGNIPSETKVVSIAIYEKVESLDYYSANIYSGLLLVFSFLILVFVYSLNHRKSFK